MDFTFGIITNNEQHINSIIHSIRQLRIPNLLARRASSARGRRVLALLTARAGRRARRRRSILPNCERLDTQRACEEQSNKNYHSEQDPLCTRHVRQQRETHL
jgi:hypothetical protein